MNTNEQRIREYAYQIWESEGRPHGQCDRHWTMACTLVQTQLESEIAGNDNQQTASTEPIEPISPTQPAQPVTPSDPIQPTDPVQPAQPVQPGSPTAQFAESPAAESAVKKSRTNSTTTPSKSKTANVDEVVSRVVANEKAAAKKKSAGVGELNTDVKFKTDLRKKDSPSKVKPAKSDANTSTVDEVISRVVANEKAAAKKKSAGTGELNTDVKFKTDFRESESKSTNDLTSEQDKSETKKAAKPQKNKTFENELS